MDDLSAEQRVGRCYEPIDEILGPRSTRHLGDGFKGVRTVSMRLGSIRPRRL
ncbi:MAG TPA: hypothetical protein VF169_24940 [Albitalea sp.]|uniref:hypothetical protein n=1 Tax=Piscinibacter sp. TaxID=1903157 RepID=UPI002ECFCD0E